MQELGNAIQIAIYFKFFVSLFALVNPIGNVPIFSSITNGLTTAERNAVNIKTSFAIAVVLLVSLFLGQLILNFFGISLNSFRIAGGILVIMISLSMVQGKISEESQNKEEKNHLANIQNFAIVPLAIPIMAGPGSISSVIVFGAKYNNLIDLIGLSIAIILFGVCCFFLFKSSSTLLKLLGKTGSNVVTRIMGLLLMALGVEIVTTGVIGVFETFIKPII